MSTKHVHQTTVKEKDDLHKRKLPNPSNSTLSLEQKLQMEYLTGKSQLSVAEQTQQGKARSEEYCNLDEKISGARRAGGSSLQTD